MKHTNISRFIALIFLILSSTTTAFFPNLFYSTFQSNEEKNSLKAAYSWTPTPFVIDDTGAGDYTWSQAVTQPWCTGSGTWSDPYIINDISINGYMRNEHSLEIQKYFLL